MEAIIIVFRPWDFISVGGILNVRQTNISQRHHDDDQLPEYQDHHPQLSPTPRPASPES